MARDTVDAREDRLAGVQLAALDDDLQRLVVVQPEHVLDAGAAVAVRAFDRSDVGHLAASGGVERGLGELDEETRAGIAAAVLAAGVAVAVARGERLQGRDGRRLLL